MHDIKNQDYITVRNSLDAFTQSPGLTPIKKLEIEYDYGDTLELYRWTSKKNKVINNAVLDRNYVRRQDCIDNPQPSKGNSLVSCLQIFFIILVYLSFIWL